LAGSGAALLVPVLRRLCRNYTVEDISPEWLESFSVASYYPMRVLFSADDFEFLSRQPGFDRALKRKLRRDRLLIFKQYLDRMIADFNRLHTLARFVLAQSSEDRSDLVGRLLWLRVRFGLTVLRVQFTYRLYWLGVPSFSVTILIRYLEEMTAQLSLLRADGQLA
jgi:hypothetical protein